MWKTRRFTEFSRETALLVLLFAAIGRPVAAQAATVEGDVYVVMQNGETRKGAGIYVRLLKDEPALREAMKGACRDGAKHKDKLWHTPETWDPIKRIIRVATVDSTPSGMAAHYRFEAVKPGRYFVVADWTITQYVFWWKAIEVTDGGKIAADLDPDAQYFQKGIQTKIRALCQGL